MIQKIIICLCGIFFLSCSVAPKNESKTYFDTQKVEGCILLFNLTKGEFEKEIGGESCKKQYSASSTFKVPLAVMAFDSGILKSEDQVLKWDRKESSRAEENADHDAKSWMKVSVVWFSQRITQKMGVKKLQKYLDDFSYGNRDLKGGLTRAWLASPSNPPALSISAYEQVEFLKKLWRDELPVSKRSMQIARDLTMLEISPKGAVLSGKTGSNFFDSERKVRLGWFISHLKTQDQEYLAVTNFRDLGPTDEKGYGGFRAKEITKQFLTDQGLF